MNKFGQRLKKIRNDNGKTQADIGKIIGVESSAISKYENDIVPIPIEHLLKLADYFCVSTDYLLGLTNENVNEGTENITENTTDINICEEVQEQLKILKLAQMSTDNPNIKGYLSAQIRELLYMVRKIKGGEQAQ